MNSDLDDFLDHVDEWKLKVHQRLKDLTPQQRAEFWADIGQKAREMGLPVIEPPEAIVESKQVSKRRAKPAKQTS